MHSIPLNVSSPLRACKNVGSKPLWISKGSGEYLFDVDGNQYIDFMYGFGPLILGHSDSNICKAICDQANKGTLFGTATREEVALADKIVHSSDGIAQVRFLNSGTEAVASAIRLARAYTKRTKVLYCYGGYHGHTDLFIEAKDCIAAGIDPAIKSSIVQVHYNDIAAIEMALASEDFSAFIIEPIACNMSLVMPEKGYLEAVREACTASGTLLVFDEVITGFRYCFGSVGNVLGVSADLYAFGKVIGGGLPVGAVAGKAKVMNLLETQTVLQGGTFSGNPMTVAAGHAALDALSQPDTYDLMAEKVTYLHELCESKLKVAGITLVSFGSTFALQLGSQAAINYTEASKSTNDFYTHLYKQARKSGIHLTPDVLEPLHVSTVTTNASIERLASVILESL